MLKAAKMNEIADEMLKTQLQIIALQELRWKGAGQINKNKHTLLQLQPRKKGSTWNRIYGPK
jgi:hypothetical protein